MTYGPLCWGIWLLLRGQVSVGYWKQTWVTWYASQHYRVADIPPGCEHPDGFGVNVIRVVDESALMDWAMRLGIIRQSEADEMLLRHTLLLAGG